LQKVKLIGKRQKTKPRQHAQSYNVAPLLRGAIALAAHGRKTAIRAAVTPSPEPLSNISLSLGEDALAIFLTWFATQHPYSAAAIVIALLAAIILRSVGLYVH
jgi:hypothetical protein